jgi:hypothetical protein
MYITSVHAFFDERQFFYYYVQDGDTLAQIAPQEQWLLIKKINRIDERHLPTGGMILLPRDETLSLDDVPSPVPMHDPVVAHFARSVVVFIDWQFFGAYEYGALTFWGPISSGVSGRHDTPRGTFPVLWKTRSYRSKKYNASMPYAINYSHDGYFLHQQALPGRPASHGCVRLLREDAKRIFEWVRENDLIIIR